MRSCFNDDIIDYDPSLDDNHRDEIFIGDINIPGIDNNLQVYYIESDYNNPSVHFFDKENKTDYCINILTGENLIQDVFDGYSNTGFNNEQIQYIHSWLKDESYEPCRSRWHRLYGLNRSKEGIDNKLRSDENIEVPEFL